jgi:hypothetical protein
MKPLAILLPALALVGCTASALNINVKVHSDGSGKVEVARISAEDAHDRSRLFRGTRNLESHVFRVEAHEAVFDDIGGLEIGGIEYKFERRGEDGFDMTVTVPGSSDSGWFRRLGFDKDGLEALREAFKREGPGMDQVREEAEEPSVILRVTMPGNIQRNYLEDLEDLPEDWELKKEAQGIGFGASRARSAVLRIPLKDIIGGKVDELVWKIACGPESREAKEELRNFKQGQEEDEEEERDE